MNNQETVVREFLKIREDIIHPTLAAIGEQLKAGGHNYQLTDDPLSTGTPLSTPYAGLSLCVFVGDFDWKKLDMFGTLNRVPFISFGLSLAEQRAVVLFNPQSEGRINQWRIRITNTYALHEVTTEIVKQEVNQFLSEIPL